MSRRNPNWFLPDDFPDRPNQGRQGVQQGLPPTEWGQLAAGKTLGKRITIPYNRLLPGESTSFLNMAEISGDDEDALQLSISLSPPTVFSGGIPANLQNASGQQDNIELPATVVFARPVANIDWGIGGVSHRATVDIVNGSHVEIAASWLRISGAIESPTGLTTTTAYVLGAFIGPGHGRPTSAQRTMNCVLPEVVSTRSSIQPIPRFAKNVILGGHVAFGNVMVADIIFFLDNVAGSDVARYTWTANNPLPIPIPGGAMFWAVQSDQFGGASPGPLYAIFGLNI